MKDSIHSILLDTFGYSSFRPLQEEVIHNIINGNDTLVIMPTGGGKSLCFQIPALAMEGMSIVISPLIALMNDQVSTLQQLGVKAAAIHSNISQEESRTIFEQLEAKEIKLLYVSPEKLLASSFLNYLKKFKLDLIAVDEAHCVSVWGNDFRPEYVKLASIREFYPDTPFIALTATADTATQDDIAKQLQLKDHKMFLGSFERHNITTSALPGQNRFQQLAAFLHDKDDQSGIVYCLSRKSTESVANKLKGEGFKTAYYHAGMSAAERSKIQQQFQNDEIKIICATIAFGMGIDKSNIRWVVHYNMPKNIESYYQEIGRAGRDGLPSKTLLFFSWADMMKLRNFIDEGNAKAEFKQVQHAKLDRMWEFANTYICRTNVILNYFGEYRSENCGHCDNCLSPPSFFDGTVQAQKALSAIIRTKEDVTLNLLIDVLRGSNKQEVLIKGFQHIKTYGAGRDLPFLHWKSYLTQMINQGIIRIDYTDSFKLKTTPLSKSILFDGTKVELVKFVDESSKKKEQKLKNLPKISATKKLEKELFNTLKQWRLELARELNIPAYTILHDKVLQDIVIEKPITYDDFLAVEGIGQYKLDQYGDDVITIVQDFLRNQDFKKNLKGKTYLETLHLYKQGLSPEEIAEKRQLSLITIFSHYAYLYEKGESIEVEQYVSEHEIEAVRAAWEKSNRSTILKEVTDHFAEEAFIAFHKVRLAISILKKTETVSK